MRQPMWKRPQLHYLGVAVQLTLGGRSTNSMESMQIVGTQTASQPDKTMDDLEPTDQR